MTEIRQSDGVVENPIRAVIVRIGATHDADDRQILAVSAGDGVDDAESADGEGSDAGAYAPGAGVSVRRITGVELVAAADEVELGLGNQVVEKREIEITGHGEDVAHPHLDEPPGEMPAQRAGRFEGM